MHASIDDVDIDELIEAFRRTADAIRDAIRSITMSFSHVTAAIPDLDLCPIGVRSDE